MFKLYIFEYNNGRIYNKIAECKYSMDVVILMRRYPNNRFTIKYAGFKIFEDTAEQYPDNNKLADLIDHNAMRRIKNHV